MSDWKKIEQKTSTPVVETPQAIAIENKIVENLDVGKKLQEIEVNIKAIKKSLDDLKKETDTFDTTKNVLDKATIDAKTQELENKKNETEKKKKETEELIKNVMALNELKKDIQWYDQNKLKLIWYEKELNELNTWSTFWDKTKQVASDIRWTTWWKVAVIAAWALSLRWLFWGSDDEESDETDDESSKKKKKKWFWDHGIGKWLKYAGVGVAWFFGIKWLLDYFNKDKQSDATDTPKEQVQARNDYLKENPEEAKKYIALWGNVDQMYSDFNKKERLSWRNDGVTLDEWYEKYANQETKDKDTFKAIVPFAVDQEFWSVEKLLSEWWYYGYIREKSGTELLDTVIWFVKSNTKSSLLPFLSSLSSFVPFVWQSTEEWIKNWFNSGDSKQREEELQLFFRQYTKIVTYMQDKHTAFKENIAEEKFKSNPWAFSSLEDAMEDEEWMQKNVLNDSEYNTFYKWSLKNGTDILTKKGLFDSKPSSLLSGIIASCDGVRWDVLNEDENWIDSLGRLYTDIKKNTISPESKKESQETIDNVTDNINEELDATFTYGAATSLHVALNTEDNNVQEFLKESWLLQFKEHLKTSLQDYKKKFANGTITVEEAKEYHRLVNSYFSFKKEIMIWSKSLQSMKSDNLSWPERALQTIKAAGGDLFDATATSMKKLGKVDITELSTYHNMIGAWLWATPVVGIWALWLYLAKQPTLSKILLKFHLAPVYALYKLPTRISYMRWLYNKLPTGNWLRSRKYIRWKGASAESISFYKNRFINDIKNKKLSLEDAKVIWDEKLKWMQWESTKSFESYMESNYHNKTYAEIEKELWWSTKPLSSLDEIGKTLTGDSKSLFIKATDEISALKREAEGAKWILQINNKLRIKKEIIALENLTKKISTLWWTEASQLLKATEKLSLRTLSKLAYNLNDTKKLWSILDDLLKNSTKIDAPEIAAKLAAAGEHKAAKLFAQENELNKQIIKELSELHASKTVLSHIDEGVEIILKLLKKAV